MQGQEPAPTALDRLVSTPRLVDIDRLDLEAPPERVWERIRHGALVQSPLVRALFAIRTGRRRAATLRIDDFASSAKRPGFQLLVDEPPHELAVGAIGQVWRQDIPFVHASTPADFSAFDEPGFAKVAWSIRLSPHGTGTHLELEVRVDTTDEPSWRSFRRYFLLVGIGSRFIRRRLLADLARELGNAPDREAERSLPGDELLPDAAGQMTHGIDIAATSEEVWPWLVQMGCGRGGYYSYDLLDNRGARSAREIHPELQSLSVGDVLPVTPDGDDGFEVLRIESPRLLVLGEPVGFAMDRRMLLGVKERAERVEALAAG